MSEATRTSGEALLEISELRTWFFTDAGIAPSVDGVSYTIGRGETLAVVGESGCGKSVTALSIMRLIPDPPGRIVGGQIRFEGRDLAECSVEEIRRIRGNRIGMIFQEPMTSLNPVYTVGNQIVEALQNHLALPHAEARERAIEMLAKVGIPSPSKRIDDYPHQMSGGMKQRVMIAMALSCSPSLLIADEPTTALDVTIQAQILDLLVQLQERDGMAMLMITHDLGVVGEVADRVVVMYAGKVVEQADSGRLFAEPRHPYTIGLFRSRPSLHGGRGGRLPTIPGMVPSPLQFPSGCRFRTRCPYATAECAAAVPPLVDVGGGHLVACHWTDSVTRGAKAETGPYIDGRTVTKYRDGNGFRERIDD